MDEFLFHMALARIWKFINQVNAYFHAQEPWKIAQKDPALFSEIVAATTYSLYSIGILLWPTMPTKMSELLAALGTEVVPMSNQLDELKLGYWVRPLLLKKTEPLFVKPEPAPVPQEEVTIMMDPEITIDEFVKVNLSVGTIISCEPLEKSDKLYKLEVDFGQFGKRQILSGVRKYFAPDDLIGKQALFVVNLAPRKMMGLESHGMLLTAQDEQGNLQLMTPFNPVGNGTKLK